MKTLLSYCLFLIMSPPLMFSQTKKDGGTIQLDDRREIFVDYFLIDELKNTHLQMHHPHDEGPVLYFNKPWEGAFSGYCTIIKDGDLFRAYYRGMPKVGKDANKKVVTCYAESKNGVNWHKPDLMIHNIDGSFANNVILADESPAAHNFSPFLDANPNASQGQKYKALGGTKKSGLIAFVSPDGTHWEKLQENPVFTQGLFDSQNVAFWSGSEQKYICYFRSWTGEGFSGFRSVSRTTSTDFIHWSPPEKMTFGDTPLEHLYTQQTSPYYRASHIYIAIGGRFMPGRQVLTEEQAKGVNVDPGYFKDCSDAFFMTSRGGNTYDRTFMESFIRPGIGLDNWVSRSNYPVLNVVQSSPEEMSVYVNQDYAQPSAHIQRYSLRIDGFVSVAAPYTGGEMITKPFTFSGHNLEINYSTSAAGELKFEIQDGEGTPMPGYTLEDSETIIGNEISRIVGWNGKTNLKGLAGKIVRMRVYMKDADLYSVRFK